MMPIYLALLNSLSLISGSVINTKQDALYDNTTDHINTPWIRRLFAYPSETVHLLNQFKRNMCTIQNSLTCIWTSDVKKKRRSFLEIKI